MFRVSSLIFWVTLALYVITLLSVSYVGVYLTYVAIPILVISGLLMVLSKPKDKTSRDAEGASSMLVEAGKASADILEAGNEVLGEISLSLKKYNLLNTGYIQ